MVVLSPSLSPPLLADFNHRNSHRGDRVIRIGWIDEQKNLVISLHVKAVISGSGSLEPAIVIVHCSGVLRIPAGLERGHQ
jgi:hypothetical protein